MIFRTQSLTLWLGTLLLTSTYCTSALADGPLEGDWTFRVTKMLGAPAPFSDAGSLFHFTEASGFQAQNSPANGQPLCTMTGVRTGTMLAGTEVCGLPRNSFGAFTGVVDSATTPRTMTLIWADSKGIYILRGGKIRD
ncbi:hypothetical protein GC163_20715 [bacterium]|nr:hypothetical protein [bacterium]